MEFAVPKSFCSSSISTPDYRSSTSSPISTFFLPSAQSKVITSSFTPGAVSSSSLDYISRHSAFRKPKSSVTSFQIGKRRMSQICANGIKNVAGTVVEDIEEFEGCKDEIVKVAHKIADAARVITLKYFRSKLFQIIDKADLSPVTIADREAEEAMRALLAEHFPSHGIYGEEWGLTMPEGGSDYVWVLDPIDGTKSFITGKPVFGTLIALMHKGVPVLGIIDQPVLQERWLGVQGQVTTLNGVEIQTRSATTLLKDAYLYTTSPHLFAGEKEEAFIRVRNKVKVPLYGCDCYAYGLVAAGHVDLVIESGLKPYDYLAIVPVVEGAGGVMTNWDGQKLRWYPEDGEVGIEVVAAGNESLHKAALESL